MDDETMELLEQVEGNTKRWKRDEAREHAKRATRMENLADERPDAKGLIAFGCVLLDALPFVFDERIIDEWENECIDRVMRRTEVSPDEKCASMGVTLADVRHKAMELCKAHPSMPGQVIKYASFHFAAKAKIKEGRK